MSLNGYPVRSKNAWYVCWPISPGAPLERTMPDGGWLVGLGDGRGLERGGGAVLVGGAGAELASTAFRALTALRRSMSMSSRSSTTWSAVGRSGGRLAMQRLSRSASRGSMSGIACFGSGMGARQWAPKQLMRSRAG